MNKSYEQFLNFLIDRWRHIIIFAAIERVHTASCTFAKENNLPSPQEPVVSMPLACLQIEIIKKRIIEVLPETSFIDYIFEAQAPLDVGDFVEVFVADHHQCISKVKDLIKRIQIK